MPSIPCRRAQRRVAGACCAVLVALMPAVAGATEPPDRAALEQQLQAARAQLDRSAREVAELSRQLYGGGTGDFARFMHGGPRGSMLGINIGGGAPREEGVEVMGVSPGGPAEGAGLRVGDVVVAVNGQALRRTGERPASLQLVEYLRAIAPGTAVKVEYLRDGKRHTASVTTATAEPPVMRVLRERMAGPLGDHPPLLPGFEGMLGPRRPFGGLELVPMTSKLGAYFGTDRGLLVVRAPQGEGLPLEEGDVLQTIGGRTPETPGHAFRILQSYQPGEKVKLGVLRQRKSLVLEATVPAAASDGEGPRPVRPPPPPPAPRPPAGDGPA